MNHSNVSGSRPSLARKFVVVAALATFAWAISVEPSLADDARQAPAPPPTAYDFDDELVAGDWLAPDIEILPSRRRGQRTSLIEVRSSFVRELYVTVEQL